MKSWFFAAAASVAIVGAGAVHGVWTDRWGTPADTKEAAARLDTIPLQIGDWEGTVRETSPGQAGAGVAGVVQRSYFNRRLGAGVVIALVNGRPGPVATHTPEACYGASGYSVGRRQEVRLDTNGRPAQFWVSTAVRTRVTEEERIRLYWAWNGGEGWAAASEARTLFPRFRFPILHKLYVLRDLSTGEAPTVASERDPVCEAFLEALLPVLDQCLFGQAG